MKRLTAALAFAVTVACTPQSDAGDEVEGVGDPCNHTDNFELFCFAGVICVETSADVGGACTAVPADCDVADLCSCTVLCNGAPPDLCFEDDDGHLAVVCDND